MSLITGIRSMIKGIINDLNEALVIIANKTINIISNGSSIIWSITGSGIQSMISMIRAKKTKIIPPGDKRMSVGIF